jgi:bifunctional non-homologous end joining protein LigD
MQAKEVRALPRGEDWLYEFLWSGERVRAVKHDGGVRVLSRDGRDVTNRFPRVAAAVAKLRCASATLDGEVLNLESYSGPALGLLAGTSDDISTVRLALLAFDLLTNEGRDVRSLSLLCRRVLLTSAVQSTPIILSPLFQGPMEAALTHAAQFNLSGVVAKRSGSAYHPNSLQNDWVKVLLRASSHRRERPPGGSRRTVAAAR